MEWLYSAQHLCDLWPLATGRASPGAQGRYGKLQRSELPEVCGLDWASCAAALSAASPVPTSPGDLWKTACEHLLQFPFPLPWFDKTLIVPVGFARLFRGDERKE